MTSQRKGGAGPDAVKSSPDLSHNTVMSDSYSPWHQPVNYRLRPGNRAMQHNSREAAYPFSKDNQGVRITVDDIHRLAAKSFGLDLNSYKCDGERV